MAEPVAELSPLDDLGQAVLAVEFAPFLLRRHHQLEGHGQTGFAAETSFGVPRSRTRGTFTGTGPMPAITSRSGK